MDDSTGDFKINPDTGDITVLRTLNFQNRNTYRLDVFARDNGSPDRRITFTTVTINLVDGGGTISNHPTSIYEFSIQESVATGNSQLNLPTIPSSNLAGISPILFQIEFVNPIDNQNFQINAATGDVTLLRALNYEGDKQHVFVRKVVSGSTVYGEQTVIVNVLDSNDNNPAFTSAISQSMNVSEATQVGQIIAVVSASDIDVINQGNLVFSLVPPNSKFNILSANDVGVIYLLSELDAETESIYNLVVSVNDGGGRSSAQNSQITVYVEDENDNSPTFQSAEYTFRKNEGPFTNSFVGQVTATDNDATRLRNAITYRIIDTDVQSVFSINNLGMISLRNELDREAIASYSFTVEASNTDGDKRTGVCLVTVVVDDINDNPPVCNAPLEYSFYENQPVGSTLFSLRATDQDTGDNGRIIYGLEAVTPSIGGSFGINIGSTTGTVTLLNSFDYETARQHTVRFLLRDSGSSNRQIVIKTITINVLDINDNNPRFTIRPATRYAGSVIENANIGTNVLTVSATDADAGTNAQITYSISSSFGNLPFVVNGSTGEIRTSGIIDYETTKSYQFYVSAMDGGLPPRSDNILVDITVQDINDNSPVFTTLIYNVTLIEGMPQSQSVLRVNALDRDDGMFGLVKYNIVSGNSRGLFVLNRDSGDLSLARALTLQQDSSTTYTLQISATDSDPNAQRQSQENVIVNVRVISGPSNNNQPMFVPSYQQITVAENRIVNNIATAFATGQSVVYSIIYNDASRPFARKFAITPTGSISVIEALNFEEVQQLSFSIRALNTISGLNGTQNVFVTVQDVDDNKPVITPPRQKSVSISELANIGQIVTTFSATDVDEVSKDKLTFSLLNTFANTFSIISNNDVGVITVNRDLTAAQNNYNLQVRVNDPANNFADLNANVAVTVKRQIAPVFKADFYTFSVLEATPNAPVGQVDATTAGITDLVYSITAATPAVSSIFSINSQSGQIVATQALDQETNPSYTFNVMAKSASSTSSATSTVIVTVTDRNDNTPIFESPSAYTVSEVFPTNTILFQVKATDMDLSNNGNIIYSLVDTSPNVNLRINGNTGGVTYISGFNFEVSTSHTVRVRAQDQGTTASSAIQSITVTVTNVNEFNPVIANKPLIQRRLPESTGGNFNLLTVSATDADAGAFGQVTYSIAPAFVNYPFRIDSTSGVLSTAVGASFDYETKKQYEFVVLASDGGNPPRNDVITINVNIDDVNDNAPVFNPQIYRITIPSSTPTSQNIIQVFATDADSAAINNGLTYSIVSGNTQSRFAVNSTYGFIFLQSSFNYNDPNQRSFQLQLSASDNPLQGGRLTSSNNAILFITVTQASVNTDLPPVFSQDYVVLVRPESTPVNQEVFRSSATDSSGNGLTYSIVSTTTKTDENIFTINPSTGSISLTTSLDFETKRVHSFLVRATDNNNGNLFATQNVEVRVTDVNDNSPVFVPPPSKTVNISEQTDVGQEIAFVAATDADQMNQNDLVFSIVAPNVPFTIVQQGSFAVLYLSNTLNAESVRSYQVELSVADKNINGQIQNRAVQNYVFTVNILDENDNTPVFSQAIYTFSVDENNATPFQLGTIIASDNDFTSLRKNFQFSIYETDMRNTFSVNSNSGVVNVRTSLDYETRKTYQFTVVATNTDVDARSGYAVVRVTVNDKNDNPPQFRGPFNFAVTENTPPETLLFRVLANDTDSGINGEVEYIFETVRPFVGMRIDRATGFLYLTGTLDYETAQRHEFTILVKDNGSPPNIVSQIYTLNVINANDNNPIFDATTTLAIDVNENSPARVIGTSRATDADAGTFGEVTYRLESATSSILFTVDTSGRISMATSLDYEAKRQYEFFVVASDKGNPSRITVRPVTVTVNDLNDNSPVFQSNQYTQTLSQAAPVGMSVIQVIATDADSGTFGEVTYTIASGNTNNVFDIGERTGVITLSKVLPSAGSYSLVVSSRDRGTPTSNQGQTTNVQINVVEVNGNQPVFTAAYQVINIFENLPVNSKIGDAVATDSDSTFNQLTYSIVSSSDSASFNVDATGSLTVAAVLDRETQSSYTFVVAARDNGANSLTGYQTVKVNLRDQNDNPPAFVAPLTQTVTISENTLTSHPIALLQVSDADTSSAGKLQLSLSGANSNLFNVRIDGTVGILSLKNKIDVTTPEQYVVQVALTDSELSASPNAIITVNVTPESTMGSGLGVIFSAFPYVFTTTENRAVNDVIGSVSATVNLTTNAQPVFRVFENNIPFLVGQTSGILTVSGNLDFEQKPTYFFHVIAEATSNGVTYTDYASVQVTVTDLNDNSPVFSGLLTASVPENVLSGTNVLQVTASDTDSGENGRVRYQILQNTSPFEINALTGMISTKATLDYETTNSYTLTIRAFDNGQSVRDAQASVVITVTDSNDNKPVFQRNIYQRSITEEQSNQLVVCAVATDADSTTNSELSYSLHSADTPTLNMFTVTATGCVMASGVPNREVKSSYTITLKATDAGNPTLSGETELLITVTDINDNSPVFASSVYNLQLADDTAVGTTILNLQASDMDIGVNGQIAYSITGGNVGSAFRIVGGNIITNALLNLNSVSAFQLVVTARDGGSPQRSSTTNVNVMIISKTSNSRPVFSQTVYNVTIPESQATGVSLMRTRATFSGSATATGILYDIIATSVNAAGKFTINSQGDVSMQQNVDYEASKSVSFNVKATSADDANAFSTAVVNVFITDVNDNAPQFLRTAFDTSFARDSKPGTNIVNVLATDADSGINKEIRYRFEPNAPYNQTFSVDSISGAVTLLRELTFNDIRNYELKILSYDLGIPSLSSVSNAVVTVRIYPDNMFKPVFSNTPFEFTLPEDSRIETVLVRVTALDGDRNLPQSAIAERPAAVNFGRVTYSMLASSDVPFFMVNNVILQGSRLDRETASSYEFYVQASDGGSPSRTTVERIKVTITDVNEPPVFTPDTYNISVSEANPIGMSVATVTAVDKDLAVSGNVRYSLVSGNNENKFRLDPITGTITLRDFLRFDTTNAYVLMVSATDLGTPPLTSAKNAAVNINVIKAISTGSNLPVFGLSLYSYTLDENVARQLGRVSATNSQNTQISYRIISSNDSSLFSITSQGDLSFSGGDYETKKQYHIQVEAFNVNAGDETARTVVTVNVRDVNDNKPYITTLQITSSVSEAAEIGEVVAVIQGGDMDSHSNGKLLFALLQSSDPFEIRTVNNTGVITLTRDLDYEAASQYILRVRVSDGGAPTLVADQNAVITVNVIDENDNNPVPAANIKSEIAVNENTPVDTLIDTIVFTDRDAGANADVEYFLNVIPGTTVPFSLGQTNGQLRLTSPLNASVTTRYNLFISARDKGTPPRQTPHTLSITVVPQNNHRPFFSPQQYTVRVNEGVLVNTAIAQLNVIDPDLVGNQYTYTIESGNTGNRFSVTNGQLLVSQPLDRETLQAYSLQISVTDSGTPPLKSQQNAIVSVTVTDMNDNNPVFSQASYTATISESAATGTPVTINGVPIGATDADEGLNQRISFALIDSTNTFSINPTSGVVTSTKTLDWFAIKQYTLIVIASDTGSPARKTTTTLTVNVSDVNEAPVFNPTQYTIDVNEAIHKDASLMRIPVQDNDEGTNSAVTLTITSGNADNKFYLDNNILKTNGGLDFEVTKTYQLQVSATDSGTPPLTTSTPAVVNISIINANDNQPQFGLNPYLVNVLEGSTNTPILQVRASDRDSNGVTYSLDSSNDTQYFTILSPQGLIFTTKTFDFEVQRRYVFNVKATDNSNPSLYSRALVIVTARDANDNNPVFNQLSYEFTVKDTIPIGTIVGQVSATDLDSTTNGQIDYSMELGSAVPFRMSGNLVVLTGTLDYTFLSSYNFRVIATDRAPSFQRRSSVVPANITITLQPSNGTAPLFQRELYNVTVEDNLPSGSNIVRVQAFDRDSGRHGNFRYSLQPSVDSSLFEIDASSGQIGLKSTSRLSYQKKKTHILFAIATDDIGLSDTSYVVIHVRGVTRPEFVQTNFVATIRDTTAVGTTLLTVYANPLDNPPVSYSILSGNELGKFEMSVSGVLTLKELLSTNQVSLYELQIVATDSAGRTSANNARVVINVIRVLTNTPIFAQNGYSINIPENTAPGVVQTVNAAGSNVEYYLVYNSNVRPSDFTIDNSTGRISSAKQFDRETRSSYAFEAIAYNNLETIRTDKTLIQVTILDVNDNTPAFSTQSIQASVSELAEVGSVIAVAKATDADAGTNGALTYSLSNTFSGLLSVDNDGRITLVRSLDFEQTASYSFDIIATDAGSPAINARIPVTVTVINENDNKPIFNPVNYERTIPETSQASNSIVQVSASDSDAFGGVTFRLLDDYNGLFTIGSQTGIISSTGPLDYETRRSYHLCVEASDSATPTLTTTINVKINLQDVNDNKPVVTLATTNPITISENSPVGQIVSLIRTTDADSGTNGQVVYTIVSGNIGRVFQVSSTGIVTLRSRLDFESLRSYSLSVTVQDRGTPPQQIDQPITLEIQVVNENDNTPVFNPSTYTESIVEGTGIRRITQVTATDNDVAATIQYSLLDESNTFTITTNGVINTKDVALDYEKRQQYELIVMASDGVRRGLARVVVNVVNVNEAPTINAAYTFAVSENTGANFLVGSVTGKDNDINTQLRYNIISGNTDNRFTVDNSGNILTATSLDYETTQIYTLGVRVSDGASPALSADTTVTINVINQNDNSPVFSQAQYTRDVFEDTNINFVVSASDADNPASLTYTIVTTDALEWFSIDSATGRLTNKKDLDYEQWKRMSFTVQASDGGGRAGFTEVVITVNDRNDNAPVFDQTSYTLVLPSNTVANAFVTRVVATDVDSGTNGQLTYVITGGNTNNNFKVESNGNVLTNKNLDASIASYQLEITARDSAVPPMSSSITFKLNITILDVSFLLQGAVTFNEALYEVTVPENFDIASDVMTVAATIESGKLGSVVYTINPQSRFSIDVTTGGVKAKQSFDFEQNREHVFCVTARNTLNSNILAVAEVKVTVTDVNDNAPVFIKNVVEASVDENAPLATFVASMVATDADTGANKAITYAIAAAGNTNNNFRIDNSGDVRVNTALNYDTAPNYTLSIQATSGTLPVASATLIVTVVNINRNTPVFERSSYNVSIKEGDIINRIVGRVVATDGDRDARMMFELVGTNINDIFSINNGGIIRNKVALDYETTTSYQFCVKVSDQQSPNPKFDITTVTVNIENKPDAIPVFTVTPDVSLPFTWPAGVEIVTVRAVDPDSSNITYSIDNSLFNIDPITGVLTLKQRLLNGTTEVVTVTAESDNDLKRRATTVIRLVFTGTSFSNVAGDLPIATNETTAQTLSVELNVMQFFGGNLSKIQSFDIYAQAYMPTSNGFNQSSVAAPVSYTQANQFNSPDAMKRFLVARVQNPFYSSSARKRRAVVTNQGLIRMLVGNQTGCDVVIDPNIPCNGPLKPNTNYRFQVIGYSNTRTPFYSPYSTATGTNNVPLPADLSGKSIRDRNTFNMYYIVALVVLGFLLIMSITTTATILFYKKRDYMDGPMAMSRREVGERRKKQPHIVVGPGVEKAVEAGVVPNARRYTNPMYVPEEQSSYASSVSPEIPDNITAVSYQNTGSPEFQQRGFPPVAVQPQPQRPPPRHHRSPVQNPRHLPRDSVDNSTTGYPQNFVLNRQTSETQEVQLRMGQSDAPMYILKRHGEGGLGPFEGAVPTGLPGSIPAPPAPPPPPAGVAEPISRGIPTANGTAGSTNQPRLTRTSSRTSYTTTHL